MSNPYVSRYGNARVRSSAMEEVFKWLREVTNDFEIRCKSCNVRLIREMHLKKTISGQNVKRTLQICGFVYGIPYNLNQICKQCFKVWDPIKDKSGIPWWIEIKIPGASK